MPQLEDTAIAGSAFNTSFSNGTTQTIYTTPSNGLLEGSFSQNAAATNLFYGVGANSITVSAGTVITYGTVFGSVTIPIVLGPSLAFAVTDAGGTSSTTSVTSTQFSFGPSISTGIDFTQKIQTKSITAVNTSSAMAASSPMTTYYTVPAGKKARVICYGLNNVGAPAAGGANIPPSQVQMETGLVIQKNGVTQSKTTSGYVTTGPLPSGTVVSKFSCFVDCGIMTAGQTIAASSLYNGNITIVGYDYIEATIF